MLQNLKMAEDESNSKKPPLSPDKLIQGVLSKLGETFDGLLGRQAKASSTLATSELAARAKKLLDSQVRDMGENGRFVPHIIQLKVEWEKFTTNDPDIKKNLEEELKKLENELLAALIDHINDNRYLTYAPLKITAKPDYFVEGIHIVTSFGETEKEGDEVDLSVTMPNINVKELIPENNTPDPDAADPAAAKAAAATETVFAKFSLHGMEKEIRLRFEPGERVIVGRTRENDLALEDQSVSKLHAALFFNPADIAGTGREPRELVVADTGSTNGTFINKERLAYGKAFPIKEGDMVTFGTVDVFFEHIVSEAEPEPEEDPEVTVEDVKGPIRIELGSDNS
jgi:hypothetical protein